MSAIFLAQVAGAAALLACSSAETSATSGASSTSGTTSDAGSSGASDSVTDAGAAADGASSDGATATSGPSVLASLTISTGSLVPAFDPSITDYTVTSLTSLHAIQVTGAVSDPAATLMIHGAAAQSGVASSFTLGPNEDFTVVATAPDGTARTYTVHYAPIGLAPYTVTTVDAAKIGDENILLTANGAHIVVIDRAGAPLYYRSFAPLQVENFQSYVLGDGTRRYSVDVGKFTSAWINGTTYVMDGQLADVAQYQLLANRAHGVLPTEGHDFAVLADDHYIGMSYVQRTADLSAFGFSSSAIVMNCVVQEVDHGAVTMEWDSADVSTLYTDSVDGNAFNSTTVADYLHLNAIEIDPSDGNLILSFRHTNSIMKIDRTTGAEIWTLGGKHDDFGLTADQIFSHQHHARIQADGSLQVFDNGNGMHQTRILSFKLDEVGHKVTDFDVLYTKPSDQPASDFMGAATQLGSDRSLYGWGGWDSGVPAASVTEVVGGAIVWSLSFTGNAVFSYRALPIPSH